VLTLAKIRADCQPKTLFVPLSTRLTQQKTIHSDGPTGSSKVSCKIPSSTPLHALSGPYEYKDLTPELNPELPPSYRAFFFLLLASRTYVSPRLRSFVRSPGSAAM
jgi:hypothetical protein